MSTLKSAMMAAWFVAGIDVQNISIHLIEPNPGEQPIKRGTADDERHACGDCLILYGCEMHLMPSR